MNNANVTCRTCSLPTGSACAWCPKCQAARLNAAQERMVQNPAPKQPKMYRNGKGVCRSQVNWCR